MRRFRAIDPRIYEICHYFRQAYVRAVAQAKEFVDFVDPQPGSVVVEVGAGSGRITFDGGLAERIGAGGQLLVTDPSLAQLRVARQRAEQLGLYWVRFLAAPVEELPLAPDSADLVLGATFLHFTNEPVAIQSMARIIHPGGRVGLVVGVDEELGAAWERAFAPIRAQLRANGVPERSFGIPQEQLVRYLEAAGLVVDRIVMASRETLRPPSAEIAVGVARQTRFSALMARGLPPTASAGIEQAFERDFRAAIDALGVDAAAVGVRGLSVVARKPAVD